MKGKKIKYLPIIIFLMFINQAFAASDVELLTGSIHGTGSKKSLTVYLLDKDGSILDITSPDSKGRFYIDVSVLDNPVYEVLILLKIRISNKTGQRRDYLISERVEEFVGTTLKVEPLRFSIR